MTQDWTDRVCNQLITYLPNHLLDPWNFIFQHYPQLETNCTESVRIPYVFLRP